MCETWQGIGIHEYHTWCVRLGWVLECMSITPDVWDLTGYWNAWVSHLMCETWQGIGMHEYHTWCVRLDRVLECISITPDVWDLTGYWNTWVSHLMCETWLRIGIAWVSHLMCEAWQGIGMHEYHTWCVRLDRVLECMSITPDVWD